MAKNVKISKEVIASLLPQRNLLNAKTEDLLNQTFNLNSVIESDEFDNDNDRIEGPVRLRFMNDKTNTIMTFPIRALLYSESTPVTDVKKYDHETSEKEVVHAKLLEQAANNDDVKIPESFTIMHVEERKNAAGNVVYPTYSYQAFQERVDAMKEGEDITDIYTDFNFMSTLPGTKLATRFADIEPVKNIVISI